MDDLLSEFIAETRETLGALAEEIVLWEADPRDRARLDAIFRFVHTVKGSCGFLDLARLERLSHAAEDVLAAVRDGRREANARLVDAVLAIIDRIGAVVEALADGRGFPSEDDDALIAALAGEVPGRVPAAAPVVATVHRAPARTIRLPIELLDRMMNGVSDMVLARNELSRRLRDAERDAGVLAAFDRLSVSVAEMRDAITRTRMARIDTLFSALPRIVRDVSAELGKEVRLDLDGGETELDRELIEMIRDPLAHLIRNALDHGIERAIERRFAGKPTGGLLRISARQAGNQILVEVSDDGRGIDADRVAAKAVASGLLSEAAALRLSRAAKLALVFEPGLTTAEAVTALSGRGVGMDVVRANIERIGGLVDIDSQPGIGTRLTLRVPMTLTIIPALTLGCAGQRFALPRVAIEEIVRIGGQAVRLEQIGGGLLAAIRDWRVPVVSLPALVGGDAEPRYLVLLRPFGGGAYALAVEAVYDHEEIVVKPAAPAVMATGIYAGVTLPDDGRPMLLLDPAGIAAVAGIRIEETESSGIAREASAVVEETTPTLLFRARDGHDRAIALALVERIEDVAASAVSLSAGRLRIAIDGRILPLAGCDTLPDGVRLRILRLSDGARDLAYAIGEVLDIVDLAAGCEPASTPGPIAGVVLVDGRQVELIDGHWLFSQCATTPPPPAERRVCLLRGSDDPWMRDILRPLLSAAGYRVLLTDQDGAAAPDIIIEGSAAGPVAVAEAAPVLRLRARPEPDGAGEIYRYDRTGLLAAIDALLAKGAR